MDLIRQSKAEQKLETVFCTRSVSAYKMAYPEASTPPVFNEKVIGTSNHVHSVTTNERVPSHSAYSEEGGLRTYGDDMDHDHEPPVRMHPSSVFCMTAATDS